MFGQTQKENTSKPSETNPARKAIVVSNAFLRFADRATLSFERPGILAVLPVLEGTSVEANGLIARLNDTVPRATLAIAEAEARSDIELRIARKAHETAVLEYQAVVDANRKTPNTYPETEVLRKKLAAEAAALQIEFQAHQVALAKLRRDYAAAEVETFALRAPFSGVITRVFHHQGEALQQREAVLELVQLRRVRVDGYVDLKDAWDIHPNDEVEVRVVMTGDTDQAREHAQIHNGQLRFVDVSAQAVRGVVRVWAEFDNENHKIFDGVVAEMNIFPKATGKTLLPSGAGFGSSGGSNSR